MGPPIGAPINSRSQEYTPFDTVPDLPGTANGVVQPDIGRVGGLTEAVKVTRLAAETGKLVVPHLWKTGISVAAAAHLATVTPHMPFFEFLPPALCESRLRKELVVDEVTLSEGRVSIPERPGLGVELNRDALALFEEAARRVRP